MQPFKLKAEYNPTGDQPQAIEELVKGLDSSPSSQTLLGVTGSGKTYTIANVIQEMQKPMNLFCNLGKLLHEVTSIWIIRLNKYI